MPVEVPKMPTFTNAQDAYFHIVLIGIPLLARDAYIYIGMPICT